MIDNNLTEEDKVWREYCQRKKTFDINMLIFHDFDIQKVKWREIFYWYEDICQKLNIIPTRVGVTGIDGKPYNYSRDRKSLTYQGGKRKLEKFNFNSQMYSLFITCMYHPLSYTGDSMSMLSVFSENSDNNLPKSVELFFEQSLYPFDIEKYEKLAAVLYEFTGGQYGYYYQLKLGLRPGFYATGSHQCAPEDDEIDQRKLKEWEKVYIRKKTYQLGDLRQIYQLNFLTQAHLSRQVRYGVNLQQWINLSKDHGELKEVKPGFWSWSVSKERIEPITQLLAPSGIILCL